MTEENPNTKRQSLWERCTFENFLIVLIVVGGVVMLVLVVRLLLAVLPILWGGSALKKSYDLLQALIWSIGGLGGAIGLWFSTQRQKTFEKQVQSQIDQVQMQSKQVQVQAEQVELQAEQVQREVDKNFDDRLGRNVELLANENITMRNIGIRGLVDLANNANEKQKSVLADIIYNFFCDKVAIKDDSDYSKSYSVEDRQDLQNALDFLVGLPSREREKLLEKRIINGRLDLRKLNFIHLHFTNKLLENVDFSQSYFYESEFSSDKIMNASFYDAKFKSSIFGMDHLHYRLQEIFEETSDDIPPKNTIHDCNFGYAEMKNTTFRNMNIESTSFHYVQCVGGGFHDVEFWGGDFCFKNPEQPMGISSYEDLPHFIGTDLGDSKFQFANVLDSSKFFEFCYASVGEHDGITPFIDESRAYEIVDLTRKFFIESDKPWSEQPVDEWVAVECAQYKLKQAKEEDIASLQRELNQTKKSLRKAQEKLNLLKRTPKSPNPKPPPQH